MKFRVTLSSFLRFLFFALFLFYLCAFLTTNINSLSIDGTLAGINAIPGFTKFLPQTILLFILFLVAIFTASSSTIFERKKGFGFEIGEKEDKGYSRWSKNSEMKKDKDVAEVEPTVQESKYAGIPLVNDGKKLWVDNGEYHNLVIGSTGSGKSQTVVIPMVELLIKKGESMIITDPKGELFKTSSDYMRKRGYNVVVLNFREPQNGNAWNPLTLPYQYYEEGNFDKATELLDDVALNILYDPNNKSGDPFWEKSAADYFSGLALGLFQDAKEEEINLNSINYMSTVGEEKFGGSNFIKEYFTMKGEASNAYVFASNTINSPTETKGGILSVFRQKIRLFASRENLSEMLAYSDFDMRNIGKEKTAVFIVIHDEKTTYHGLATIFIKQCYETLIDVAQANGGKLPYRTNFILDEFANMPPLKDVTTMVTAARSRAIRFTFIIQNFAQLKSVYGNEDAETIKGNCGNLVYLISTELAALEEISKMCGEKKSDDKDKTASTPLVTVTDLQKLKLFEAIIIRWRLSPFKTKYTPNFKMDWGHDSVEANFPVREKKAIQLFDVKVFVREKKRQNMLNSLDSNQSGNPMGGMAPGPFGGANMGASPFGASSTSPFGGGASSNPFGGGSSSNPFGAPDPFASNMNNMSPFGGLPNSGNDSGMFGGMSGGINFDEMLKDIDRKIAELDAEEARQKAEAEKNKNEVSTEASTEAIVKNESIKDAVIEENISTKMDLFEIDTHPEEKSSLELPVIVEKEQTSELEKKEHSMGMDPDIDDEIIRYQVGKKSNYAVATSSPVDEFDFDELPKVENTSIIHPNYSSGSVVKTNTEESYNIYDKVPNIIDTVKDEIKSADKVKEDYVEFVDSLEISKDKLPEVVEKMDEYNIYNRKVESSSIDENKVINIDKVEEKPNINIDPDKVSVNSNIISDDEFFDDFFGED